MNRERFPCDLSTHLMQRLLTLLFHLQILEVVDNDDGLDDMEESKQNILDDEDFTEYKVRNISSTCATRHCRFDVN